MRLKIVVMVSVICCNFCISLAAPSDSKNPELLTNSIGIVFKLIPAGSVRVGEGETAKEITVSKPFYLGVTEVTNAQAMALMGFIPSEHKDAQIPVGNVTWEEATRFCEILSTSPKERVSKRVYRLPTKNEWEFACRAGTKTKYFFGDQPMNIIGHFAWFGENSGGRPHSVGMKRPNQLGLYDMYGNVWEWCSDLSESGLTAVAQGGAYGDKFQKIGSSITFFVEKRMRHTGFRLALSPPDDSK